MSVGAYPIREYPIYMHGVRTEPKVALTFDDGPNPPRTEQVLEILARANIRATFFVMGKWAERFPRSIDRMLAAGHLIGNHGYAGQGLIGDYDQAEAIIGHLTGVPSRYLRAHTYNHGAYFQSKVSRLSTSLAIGCDVDSHDWRITDAGTIARNVLDDPRLGAGSIINLHDGSESEDAAMRLQRPVPMIEALPRIIAGLQERRLSCVRVDELTLAKPIAWAWGDEIEHLRAMVR